MGIFDHIILGILGLVTIRDIISFFGIPPRDKKWSWIFYKNYETDLVIHAMKEAGIKEYDRELVRKAMQDVGIERDDVKELIVKKRFKTEPHSINLENLIEIIANYMICHEGRVEYGYKTPIKTSFYISSVEASYDDNYLEWMCLLLNDLILKKKEEGIVAYLPDFIVTPKGGNTYFGRTYADKRHILFITSKYSLRSSYVKFLTKASEYELKTNYEGSWKLLEIEEGREPDRKLRGIVVDCNTATGEQIIDTMADFNELVSKMEIQVEPLKYAFTLYRSTDNSLCDVDSKFAEKGFRLFRYFDLSEDNKKMILDQKGGKQRLDVYVPEDRDRIKQMLDQMEILA